MLWGKYVCFHNQVLTKLTCFEVICLTKFNHNQGFFWHDRWGPRNFSFNFSNLFRYKVQKGCRKYHSRVGNGVKRSEIIFLSLNTVCTIGQTGNLKRLSLATTALCGFMSCTCGPHFLLTPLISCILLERNKADRGGMTTTKSPNDDKIFNEGKRTHMTK